MIVPCIDLQDGKVVQLVQGKEKALEGEAPLKMLVVVAAIAFAATFMLFLDKGLDLFTELQGEEDPELTYQGRAIFWFIAGSFAVMVAGGMLILELRVMRIHALRRLMEIQMRALEQVHHESQPEDE